MRDRSNIACKRERNFKRQESQGNREDAHWRELRGQSWEDKKQIQSKCVMCAANPARNEHGDPNEHPNLVRYSRV